MGDVHALSDAMHSVLADKTLCDSLIEDGRTHRRRFLPQQSIMEFNWMIEAE